MIYYLYDLFKRNVTVKFPGKLSADAECCSGSTDRDYTPILAYLHWLPVKSRIKFKILLLTFGIIRPHLATKGSLYS